MVDSLFCITQSGTIIFSSSCIFILIGFEQIMDIFTVFSGLNLDLCRMILSSDIFKDVGNEEADSFIKFVFILDVLISQYIQELNVLSIFVSLDDSITNYGHFFKSNLVK